MPTIRRATRQGTLVLRGLLAGCVVACSNDAPCLALPCPIPIAAIITVTEADLPAQFVPVAETISGHIDQTGPCSSEPTGSAATCGVFGGAGTYHVTISAANYRDTTLDFTATGNESGCRTCDEVDTRQLTVVLEPTSTTQLIH